MLSNVGNPVANQDATTKLYVDNSVNAASKFNATVISETDPLSLATKVLSNVGNPVAN